MRKGHRFSAALIGMGLVVALSGCTSTTTTSSTATNEAYCTSSAVVLSELATLRDMVSSGDSTRNQISGQGEVVVNAAVTAYRDSSELTESVRADIQAADKAFTDAVRAIPSTTDTAAEVTQAYKAAMDAYNTSIDAVRASLDC